MIVKTIIVIQLCLFLAEQGFTATNFDRIESNFSGGHISGKLLKSNGRPQRNTELELVPVEDEAQSSDMRLWAIADWRGNFSFSTVPNGNYTLSINFNERPSDTSPYVTTFYPNVPKRSNAQVFRIRNGIKYSHLKFKLLPSLTRKPISGRVVLPNGIGVKNAYISLVDAKFPMVAFGEVKTNARGFFTVRGFVGWKYTIFAVLFDTAKLGRESKELRRGRTGVFTLRMRNKPIRVVLDEGLPADGSPSKLKTLGGLVHDLKSGYAER